MKRRRMQIRVTETEGGCGASRFLRKSQGLTVRVSRKSRPAGRGRSLQDWGGACRREAGLSLRVGPADRRALKEGRGLRTGSWESGAWSWALLRRLRKMAADEAADTQLMLGVGLIGENTGALPLRPVHQFHLPAAAAPRAARCGEGAGPSLLGLD